MKSSFLKKLCDFDKKGLVFPLFPYWVRYISMGIIVVATIVFLTRTYLEYPSEEFVRFVSKQLLILGLLMALLSKEKFEDERIQNLRFRAFSFSFVLTILFFIAAPLILAVIDYIFNSSFTLEPDKSLFRVFFLMMSFQVVYFETFKRQL